MHQMAVPMPHSSSMTTFKCFADHPFECRLKRFRNAMAVAEVCTKDQVPNIAVVVIDFMHGNAEDIPA